MEPLFLAGPTASGKSELALLAAEELGGEIISVDSMQVYRGLDIGTAKPTTTERQRIPHHLIDIVDLTEAFDAARFVHLANAASAEIQSRGHLPIFCGGTGLYFRAFLEGLGEAPPSEPGLRKELEATPLHVLLEELAVKDPVTFQRIDQKNPRRVCRAVEVIRLTGKPFSVQRATWVTTQPSPPTRFYGLRRTADDLRQRIDARVSEMFAKGLMDEVQSLLARGLEQNQTAMQAIGYRQVVEYLRGVRSRSETIELVKIRTHQFAKRQMTWFKRQLLLHWIDWPSGQPASKILASLRWLALTFCLLNPAIRGQAAPPTPDLPAQAEQFSSDSSAQFSFSGFVGRRIDAMVDNWLLRAPEANPGMLEMFRDRDRNPPPNLVPWAGEFVGKYLISAIQTLQLTTNPALANLTRRIVEELIATQAGDGYLGPFPKAERLRGHWDLWGHYHCILALLLWEEMTGEDAALACARRAADLVCSTYLDSGRRAIEAGSDEMNLAIIHGLGRLYRATHEPRYRRMMEAIEKDWEKAGDYFRKGLEGIEFYQTPRPRWESLPDLQGLAELYRIKNDRRYLQSFEHHWRSIARFDLRNTGGFSSGEQATGNPFASTAIETCCTIAWMSLCVDMLRLTGDSRVADKLELATLNAWAGAQHPSGRWCTYSTPMDGVRQSSAHEIVFQSRAGTPELNCCSVNGPRGWSMLAEWATMRAPDGVVQNWLGPGTARVTLPNGHKVLLRVGGNYPVEPRATILVKPEQEEEFTLRIRIPEWASLSNVVVAGSPLELSQAEPGSYLTLQRRWKKGDEVALDFDFPLRAVPGAKEAAGKVSLYRGPILLAWDQRLGHYDEGDLPLVDMTVLKEHPLKAIDFTRAGQSSGLNSATLGPQVLLETSSSVRLCDFASAGVTGSRYRSWLAATNLPPAPTLTQWPRDGASIPRGEVRFRVKRAASRDWLGRSLQISPSEAFTELLANEMFPGAEGVARIDQRFEINRWYYWRIISSNNWGTTASVSPAARFRVNASLSAAEGFWPKPPQTGPQGELVTASLQTTPAAEFGKWIETAGWKIGSNPAGQTYISLDGKTQKLAYALEQWPEEDYSVALSFRLEEFPTNRLGQVFSAWAGGSDDPLRLVIDKGKLYGRIEAGAAYSTPGVDLSLHVWYRVVTVKAGDSLNLYVDGKLRGSARVPTEIQTRAKDFALGGNPHYTGNECLTVALSDFTFYGKALSESEAAGLATSRPQ